MKYQFAYGVMVGLLLAIFINIYAEQSGEDGREYIEIETELYGNVGVNTKDLFVGCSSFDTTFIDQDEFFDFVYGISKW